MIQFLFGIIWFELWWRAILDNFWTGLKCSRKTLAEELSKEISGGYYQLTMFWSGTVVEGHFGSFLDGF